MTLCDWENIFWICRIVEFCRSRILFISQFLQTWVIIKDDDFLKRATFQIWQFSGIEMEMHWNWSFGSIGKLFTSWKYIFDILNVLCSLLQNDVIITPLLQKVEPYLEGLEPVFCSSFLTVWPLEHDAYLLLKYIWRFVWQPRGNCLVLQEVEDWLLNPTTSLIACTALKH